MCCVCYFCLILIKVVYFTQITASSNYTDQITISQIFAGLHVLYLLFLFHFNQSSNLLTSASKTPNIIESGYNDIGMTLRL
jgi:hypothetical protein